MVLFKPLSGKPLATIEFSELCTLEESGTLTGSFVTECGELNAFKVYVGGNCATHRVEQLLKEVSLELRNALGDKLKFGASEAFLDGIVAVKFGATCIGCLWGGDAV
jgi:hypothetical protein